MRARWAWVVALWLGGFFYSLVAGHCVAATCCVSAAAKACFPSGAFCCKHGGRPGHGEEKRVSGFGLWGACGAEDCLPDDLEILGKRTIVEVLAVAFS